MKFLEYTPFDRLNMFLGNLNLGESTLQGSLEAYSCKHTGTDRKLSFSLEQEMIHYLEQSSDSDSSPPMSDMSNRLSRKTLIYLVLTLSHMYPDYNFSALQAHLFFREEGWDSFKQFFDTYMFEAAKEWALVDDGPSLLESICKAINELVNLDECEIYSYDPDFDGNPFMEDGAIWAFNFFFYNRKLKRVVSFRCCCLSNLVADADLTDEITGDDEDDYMLADMDM